MGVGFAYRHHPPSRRQTPWSIGESIKATNSAMRLLWKAGAMIRRWCRQSSPSLVSSGLGHARLRWRPPRNAALAEPQNAIRTSNYSSSSEVPALGHIRNKTVTAATQTPAIRNHAGAREVDTEIPLFLLSNIRAPCMSCTPIFKPFLSAASQTVGSVQPKSFTVQASAIFATSGSSMGERARLASIQSSVNCHSWFWS